MDPNSKYNRVVVGLDGIKTSIDVYRTLVAFNIKEPELQHSLKKLLCLGIRGKGNYNQDLDEAILGLEKLKERKKQEELMNNKITVYGTPTCCNCKSFKRMLEEKKYEFKYCDDMDVLMEVSSKTNILIAPIVKINEEYMNCEDAKKLISTWSN